MLQRRRRRGRRHQLRLLRLPARRQAWRHGLLLLLLLLLVNGLLRAGGHLDGGGGGGRRRCLRRRRRRRQAAGTTRAAAGWWRCCALPCRLMRAVPGRVAGSCVAHRRRWLLRATARRRCPGAPGRLLAASGRLPVLLTVCRCALGAARRVPLALVLAFLQDALGGRLRALSNRHWIGQTVMCASMHAGRAGPGQRVWCAAHCWQARRAKTQSHRSRVPQWRIAIGKQRSAAHTAWSELQSASGPNPRACSPQSRFKAAAASRHHPG